MPPARSKRKSCGPGPRAGGRRHGRSLRPRGIEGMSRVAVIGASGGLGRCIAIGLAQRGARVALLARRRTRLEDAAKEAGPGSVAIECDITDEASCRSA